MSDFQKGMCVAVLALFVVFMIGVTISHSIVYFNNLADSRMAGCVSSGNTYGSCYSNIVSNNPGGQFSKN